MVVDDAFAAAFTSRPQEEAEIMPWSLPTGVEHFDLEAPTPLEASARLEEGRSASADQAPSPTPMSARGRPAAEHPQAAPKASAEAPSLRVLDAEIWWQALAMENEMRRASLLRAPQSGSATVENGHSGRNQQRGARSHAPREAAD